MTRVVVFGAGPAGLLAAHAATMAGLTVDVFANGYKSELYGAQYLHMEIPGVPCGEPRPIRVVLNGTAAGYRQKVYGDNYQGPVSPSALENGHMAWDIRGAYDWLWDRYGGERVGRLHLNRANVDEIYRRSMSDYDFAFCSIPLRDLCQTSAEEKPHGWDSQKVFAIGDAPDLGIMCPIGCPDEMMQYDGTRDVGWYRSARIFGHTTCEWPAAGRKPPLQNLATVTKPLFTNCDCFSQWIRIGRYGEWKKGILAHHAYLAVWQTLKLGVQDALFERP